MTMEWTRGPLTTKRALIRDNVGGYDCAIYDSRGYIVGEAFEIVEDNVTMPCEANARLWSVAPELIEALEDLLQAWSNQFEGELDECTQARTARKVIAKAKGEGMR